MKDKKSEKQEHKKKKKDSLDTETTFVNMNVEGFKWYHPESEKGSEMPALSKNERRAIIMGAISAYLPLIGGVLLIMLLIMGLAYVWLS